MKTWLANISRLQKIKDVLSNMGKPEVYVEPSRKSTMELFCKISQRVKAKWVIVHVQLGYKYASISGHKNNFGFADPSPYINKKPRCNFLWHHCVMSQ